MSIKGFEVGGVQAKYDYESLDNIPANLVQDANYVHTDNNFTNADKTKLSGIEAQANKTTIDATLTHSGQAADAKATGDAISALNAQVIASMPHDTASGSIANFPDGAAMPVIDCSVAVAPYQSGSGDPSPDNIRPISGWTEAKVTRTGINVWDEEWKSENGYWNISNGQYVSGGGTWRGCADYIPILPSTTYRLYVGVSGSTIGGMCCYDKDKTFIQAKWPSSNGTFSTPSNAYYITFYAPQSIWSAPKSISINYPSTDTDYHSGADNETYTITFPTEAGTVYGGTLDVTTGKLTVDMKYDQMTYAWLSTRPSAEIGYNANISQVGGHSVWVRNWSYTDYPATISGGIKAICNAFPVSMHDSNIFSSQYRTYFGVGSMTSVAEFLAAVQTLEANGDGLWIAHELKTPIEVDLTPNTEISTLYGTNNIFADCGDITVDYYADTTLFVNKKIAAAVAALS